MRAPSNELTNKRAKITAFPARNAHDIASNASHDVATSVLEIVAENGWFPWQASAAVEQNRDYSSLRLLSRRTRTAMDAPARGGPDFNALVRFLNGKNGFHGEEMGFCDHCYSEEYGCDTCAGWNHHHTDCECKESHRHGPVLRDLDPRLDRRVEFGSLPLRERAKRLLKFLRQVVLNFHNRYYLQTRDRVLRCAEYYEKKEDEEEAARLRAIAARHEWPEEGTPDLTVVPAQYDRSYYDDGVFRNNLW